MKISDLGFGIWGLGFAPSFITRYDRQVMPVYMFFQIQTKEISHESL
ncbi:Uncharacterized protein dnm_048180 [Desulfonema magnum]|uniref:Uncharacterized protein n=1 Tax=Desulfonema magnum TaxID=45655 RepID=A0A975BNH1_9BACT|nr:Uncharacterized protein dnm_048180 [Desulfonema magnum]